MNLLQRLGVAHARVNWGRWLADCPSADCHSALALYRQQAWFECLDCGFVFEIVWPDHPQDVERVLVMRPDPFTRNWEPGESLQDLYLENLDHGIYPIPLDQLAAHQGHVFQVDDDRILIDRAPLPPVRRRHQIEGGQ